MLMPGVSTHANPTIVNNAKTKTLAPDPLASLEKITLEAIALSKLKMPSSIPQSNYKVPMMNN